MNRSKFRIYDITLSILGLSIIILLILLFKSHQLTADISSEKVLLQGEYNYTKIELRRADRACMDAEGALFNAETVVEELERQIDNMMIEIDIIERELEEYKRLQINPNDITVLSHVTIDELNLVLSDTGLEGLAEAYIQAEKEYGINAIYLVGLTALESSWGKSRLATERNNISSYMAYDHDVNQARYFESKSECILITVDMLKRDYLTEGGKYYNGLGLDDINVKYASDDSWNWKIENIGLRIYDEIKEVR